MQNPDTNQVGYNWSVIWSCQWIVYIWWSISEIVPKNRTESLVGRKPVNCCHYEKKQTKIQCWIQDQSGAWSPKRAVDLSTTELAQKHEIHPNQIAQWKREFLDNAADIFSRSGKQEKPQQNDEQTEPLYQKIGQLQIENDFLKIKLLSWKLFKNVAPWLRKNIQRSAWTGSVPCCRFIDPGYTISPKKPRNWTVSWCV